MSIFLINDQMSRFWKIKSSVFPSLSPLKKEKNSEFRSIACGWFLYTFL